MFGCTLAQSRSHLEAALRDVKSILKFSRVQRRGSVGQCKVPLIGRSSALLDTAAKGIDEARFEESNDRLSTRPASLRLGMLQMGLWGDTVGSNAEKRLQTTAARYGGGLLHSERNTGDAGVCKGCTMQDNVFGQIIKAASVKKQQRFRSVW